MSVSVRVQENVENSNALYLDMAYIGDENGRKFVYKVDEDFPSEKGIHSNRESHLWFRIWRFFQVLMKMIKWPSHILKILKMVSKLKR